MYKFLITVGIISLYASFTNVVPISALTCMFFFTIPFVLIHREKTNKIVFAAIVLLLYFLLSTMVYDCSAITDYDFYRYDGNVFISMMPLIILGSLNAHFSLNKILNGFLYITTLVNLIFMSSFLLTGNTFVEINDGLYHLLFKAHNAAGGFLMIVSSLCFGLYYLRKERKYLFMLIFNTLGLMLTYSRGSIIGFGFGIVALYCIRKKCLKYLVSVMFVLQIIAYTAAYYYAPDNFMMVNLYSVDGINIEDSMDRAGTFINRFFYLWPRAIHLFLQSPILGTGFGSYDDWPYGLVGGYGFMVNESDYIHTDGHAHNSYLNVLAETGIVGLLVLFYFIKQMYIYLKNNMECKYKRGIAYGLMVCLWASLASATTEHRLFTPAQMLPFYTLLGLMLANKSEKSK